MQLNEIETLGVTAGLGAMNAVKRIRRIQEGVMNLPKDFLAKEEESQVARVNHYFDQMKTEVIDEPKKD